MSIPTLSQVLPVYIRIGLLSFGGPAGQIALMQDELVSRRSLVSPEAFQRGLNVAMLLPGPEAQQLATWLGWRVHGLAGGLAAGLAFILPGTALILLLAWIAAEHGEAPFVSAIFAGVQPAVLAIVGRAVVKLAKRNLRGPAFIAIAVSSFAALWLLNLPFPLVIAAAGLAGLFLPTDDGERPEGGSAPIWPSLRLLAVFAALVLAVWLAVRSLFGADPFDRLSELFLSAAFVSFGGAYALLPYVADRAVETYGWLSAAEMLNGLAIAEATPGPLILVNVYAGYFAGHPGQGVLTGLLACFYTFAPSFALILAAAPHVEAMQRARWIRRALAGVSAAVVGVIANLALYLSQAALFPGGVLDPVKIALTALFVALIVARPVAVTTLVILGALAGLAIYFVS